MVCEHETNSMDSGIPCSTEVSIKLYTSDIPQECNF